MLDNVDFTLCEGEIDGVTRQIRLPGKSTLMRIIDGLILPNAGSEVQYRNQAVNALTSYGGIAMVFQNFALLPWLTVLQNGEFGLEALGVGAQSAAKQADALRER